MNAADIFVKCLENEGVKYIFGVPGEENEAFLFALENSEIQFIPVRHEQGGAFIANVWGRLTGEAGVCLSTLGPGATNLLTGVADANLDKAPVIAITGQGSNERLHHESHQIIDVVDMMKAVTKWNATITQPSVIPEIVRKAFKLAQEEKPGATHIELPENIADMEVSEDITSLPIYNVRRPSPDTKALNEAASLISQAKKPIIVAGNGAIRKRASKALTEELSTKHNIPVACTFMGKGAVSDADEHCLGAVGLGFKDYIIEAFEQADLVISIGYDIAEYDPVHWNRNNDKKIVHIDFTSAEVFTHYIPNVEIVADIAETIKRLSNVIGHQKWDNWYTSIRSRIKESIESYSLDDSSGIFNAPGVINAVRDILPDDGLLISDVGSHKMWIARNYQTYEPNSCLISNGLASMGISLPGGIAAAMVDDERPVIAMMGDGGSMMNIQELETAHRLGLHFIIIILNDNNYGLIEWKQAMSEGKSFGTKLTNPDFVKLSESFGVEAYKPTDVSHLKSILNNAIDNKILTLIEIPIETDVNDKLVDTLKAYFKN
jgi:acetolactate synthase-1/2/3 large subunit